MEKNKKSALTVRNTTIMTRSRSLFFKIFSSTRIHPQQESRGDPSSVVTLPDTTVSGSSGFLTGNVYYPSFLSCLSLVHRVLLPYRLQPSWGRGFSPRWRLLLRITGSRALGLQCLLLAASRYRLRLTGSVAQHERDHPRPGWEPVALALQSRFVATGAPEKPWKDSGSVSVRASAAAVCSDDDVIIRSSSTQLLNPSFLDRF